jgi:hypothetical protein
LRILTGANLSLKVIKFEREKLEDFETQRMKLMTFVDEPPFHNERNNFFNGALKTPWTLILQKGDLVCIY